MKKDLNLDFLWSVMDGHRLSVGLGVHRRIHFARHCQRTNIFPTAIYLEAKENFFWINIFCKQDSNNKVCLDLSRPAQKPEALNVLLSIHIPHAFDPLWKDLHIYNFNKKKTFCSSLHETFPWNSFFLSWNSLLGTFLLEFIMEEGDNKKRIQFGKFETLTN